MSIEKVKAFQSISSERDIPGKICQTLTILPPQYEDIPTPCM